MDAWIAGRRDFRPILHRLQRTKKKQDAVLQQRKKTVFVV